MKKLLLLAILLVPGIVSAATSVPLIATSTTSTLVFPAAINGTYPALMTPFINATSTTATSTINGSLFVTGRNAPYLRVGSTTPAYGYDDHTTIDAGGTRNDFLVVNTYNNSDGNCATSDFAANNDNATIGTNFADLGHTSSKFTGVGCANNPFTGFGANSTYLFDPSGNINIALGSTTNSAYFGVFAKGYADSNRLLTVLASGNVGIGTTSPDSNLSIAGGNTNLHISGSGVATLSLEGGSATQAKGIKFGYLSNGTQFSIGQNSQTSSTRLGFFTSDVTADGAPSMVMDSSGRIGIGTTSPQDLLELYGNTKNLRFTNPTGGGSQYIKFYADASPAEKLRIGYNEGSGDSEINQLYTAHGINFMINSASKMFIEYTGLVGIGTTSPSGLLTVSGSNNGTSLTSYQSSPNITIINRSQTNNSFTPIDFRMTNSVGTELSGAMITGIATDHTSASEDEDLAFHSIVAGTFSEKMRLQGSNLGIGTTSPMYRLSVKGAGTAAGIAFQVTNSNDIAAISVTDSGLTTIANDLTLNTANPQINTTSGRLRIQATPNSANVTFVEGGSGSIGVGTSTPAIKFDVYGDIRAGIAGVNTQNTLVTNVSGGRVGIGLSVPARRLDIGGISGGVNAGIGLADNNFNDQATISVNNSNNELLIAGTDDIRFYTGSTIGNTATLPTNERMVLTAAGLAGIGTSSPSSLFQTFSTATSTISIDSNSATKGSCIEMKDSDGSGYTYVTANNGVLTASTISCK